MPHSLSARSSLHLRLSGSLFILCSLGTALAQTAPAPVPRMLALSDALTLPHSSELERDLERSRRWSCPAADPAAALHSALVMLERQLAALQPGDPNRPTFEALLTEMRSSASAALPPSGSPEALNLEAALHNARSWLERGESAGLRAFEASPESRSAASAQQAALSAAALGKPQAVLAALLAAERLNPGDAQVHLNLGGVHLHLGLTAEAWAVLEAIEPPQGVGALGWPAAAAWHNNRGHALLRLGRVNEAEVALEQAVALAPDLAEASLNLGRVQTCLGKREQGRASFAAGLRRSATPTPAQQARDPLAAALAQEVRTDPHQGSNGSRSRRPVHALYDLSKGHSITLPTLKVPASPDKMMAMFPQYKALRQELEARSLAMSQRGDELAHRLRARGEASPALEKSRRALWEAALFSDREPRIAALERAMHSSAKHPDRIWTDFWHCEGGCKIDVFMTEAQKAGSGKYLSTLRGLCIPALEAEHNRFRGAMHAWAGDTAAYLKASYHLRTALAAHTSDPLWHEHLSLLAEHQAVSLHLNQVTMALLWAGDIQGFSNSCVRDGANVRPSSEKPAAALELPRAGLCTSVAGGWSASLTIGVASVSMSCESVSVGAATPGWIGAFGTLSHGFGSDEYTVFVGVQESVGIPRTPVAVSSQQGVYLTWGNKGLVDAGAQVSSSVAASGTLEDLGLSRDLLTPLSGALSGQWSFVSSAGSRP